MRTLVLAVAVMMGIAACSSGGGGSSAPPSTPPSTPSSVSSSASPSQSINTAAARAAIKRNWEAFFSKTTPVDKKLHYLEHGDTLKPAVALLAKDPRMKQVTAKVTSVLITSPTKATVNYQVLLNSTVALPNAVGTAVLEGGVWKVSVTTLCGLVALMGGATRIPGC